MEARVRAVLSRGLQGLIGAIVVCLVALAFLQVVLRYVFAAPLLWVEEISVMALIWLAWIGVVYLWLSRAHIAVDLITTVLTPAGRRRLAHAFDGLALLGGAVLGLISLGTIEIYSGFEMGSLEIEAAIKYYPITAGGAGLAVAAIVNIWRRLGSPEDAA
ncbi:MAG: TRAP transporter small permease subunit [Alphaproteobacteria bacterium]|nr:TRAP transporter small permease subunit [Alphaproteobacteria bacterium]MDP6563391.1 TRAP transporter small permease subunit [Alphaproteobacteria bacterium]MDP6812127.1 TRAP transporter small permease subunit [Alphaproteobacteria bacterium]